MSVRDQRSDVGPMIDTWQGSAPMAYAAQGVFPDPGALAAWMEKMLQTSGGLKLTRSAVDPYDRAVAYLKAEGVDVERELAAAGRGHEADRHRVSAAADRARDLALNLKAAEKRLLFEARSYNQGCTGYTAATLREAQERVGRLAGELTAACCDDPELARAVSRSVA